jgi:hypothetical protein
MLRHKALITSTPAAGERSVPRTDRIATEQGEPAGRVLCGSQHRSGGDGHETVLQLPAGNEVPLSIQRSATPLTLLLMYVTCNARNPFKLVYLRQDQKILLMLGG